MIDIFFIRTFVRKKNIHASYINILYINNLGVRELYYVYITMCNTIIY